MQQSNNLNNFTHYSLYICKLLIVTILQIGGGKIRIFLVILKLTLIFFQKRDRYKLQKRNKLSGNALLRPTAQLTTVSLIQVRAMSIKY